MEGMPLMTLNEKGYFITLVLQNLSHILFLEVYFIYTYIIVMQQKKHSTWMIVFTKNHCLGI
jgi:hypothetical protein